MELLFYSIKALFVLSLLCIPWVISIPLLFISYYLFHYVLVPKFFGLEPMTLIDVFMFCETPLNRCHWGSMTYYDKVEYSKLRDIRVECIKKFVKLRRTVVPFFGSYYFKTISQELAEKAIEKVSGIHTKRELEVFLNKVFHQPFPKEGPLWRVFIIDDYSEKQSVQISILHHCLYDGLAGVFLTWSTGQEDVTMLPGFRPTTLKEQILLYIGLFYSLPAATIKILLKKPERNPINNGKPLSGEKRFALYDDIPFEPIKENYKKAGCTLNDYFLGVLSKSLKEYFKLKDPSGVHKTVNIGFPINLRNDYPKKCSDVQLENKITAADITIPLIDDPISESKKISKIITKLKNAGEFFANGFFLKFGSFLMPKYLMCKVNTNLTSKITLCFSNVPFFRKPLKLKGTEIMLQNEIGFLNNNSDIGLALAIVTYVDRVSISVVADTNRLSDPDELAAIFRKNLRAPN